MSTTKYTFRARVVIKRCPLVFMDGGEPGVIAYQEVMFDVDDGGKNHWAVTAALNDFRQELLEDSVEVILEQIEPKVDK